MRGPCVLGTVRPELRGGPMGRWGQVRTQFVGSAGHGWVLVGALELPLLFSCLNVSFHKVEGVAVGAGGNGNFFLILISRLYNQNKVVSPGQCGSVV